MAGEFLGPRVPQPLTPPVAMRVSRFLPQRGVRYQ